MVGQLTFDNQSSNNGEIVEVEKKKEKEKHENEPSSKKNFDLIRRRDEIRKKHSEEAERKHKEEIE